MGYLYDVYKNGNLICKGVTSGQISEKIGVPLRYAAIYAGTGYAYKGVYRITHSDEDRMTWQEEEIPITGEYREEFSRQWQQAVAPFRRLREQKRRINET